MEAELKERLEVAARKHREIALKREFLREAMTTRQFGVNSGKRAEWDALQILDNALQGEQAIIQQHFMDYLLESFHIDKD